MHITQEELATKLVGVCNGQQSNTVTGGAILLVDAIFSQMPVSAQEGFIATLIAYLTRDNVVESKPTIH
jgi:hypothetical protein